MKKLHLLLLLLVGQTGLLLGQKEIEIFCADSDLYYNSTGVAKGEIAKIVLKSWCEVSDLTSITVQLKQGNQQEVSLNPPDFQFILKEDTGTLIFSKFGNEMERLAVPLTPVSKTLLHQKEIPPTSNKGTLGDALEMVKRWESKDYAGVRYYLDQYGITEQDYNSIIYLRAYRDKLIHIQGILKTKEINEPQVTGRATTNVMSGILDPTGTIDALGKFAVKRFKEELSRAYLDSFRIILTNYPELQMLIPGIYHTLQYSDPFHFQVFMRTLRENAESDLHAMPAHLQEFLRKRKEDNKFTGGNTRYAAIMTGLDAMQALQNKLPAATLIETVAERDYIRALDSDFAKTARLLGLLSRHLHNWENSTETGWAKNNKLLELVQDDNALNFWMTLWLTREKIHLSESRLNLYKDLNSGEAADRLQMIRSLIVLLIEIQGSAEEIAGLKNNPRSDTLKYERFADYMLTVIELTEKTQRILKPVLNDGSIAQTVGLLRTAHHLYVASKQGQYGVVLSNSLQFINIALTNNTTTDTIKFLRIMNRYGNFLVTLANAKTSEEMLEALEAAALPPQSYRLKRQNRVFNASLNLYPGLAAGCEISKRTSGPDSVFASNGFVAAFTAPLGVGLNWGGKKGGAFSLFMPLIDVGAVAAFRFEDNVSPLPELKWSNVFAPGLYMVIGFRKSPLSLGIGTQYGPGLRKITEKEATIETRNLRVGLTLTADVPVFNLFSTVRKKKD